LRALTLGFLDQVHKDPSSHEYTLNFLDPSSVKPQNWPERNEWTKQTNSIIDNGSPLPTWVFDFSPEGTILYPDILTSRQGTGFGSISKGERIQYDEQYPFWWNPKTGFPWGKGLEVKNTTYTSGVISAIKVTIEGGEKFISITIVNLKNAKGEDIPGSKTVTHGLEYSHVLDYLRPEQMVISILRPIKDKRFNDSAMMSPGGIDMNAANLNLVIKRDGKGVPLPLAQQDLAQLSNIEGLDPVILSIKPTSQTPLFSQLQTSP